jgi:hypothetical protein
MVARSSVTVFLWASFVTSAATQSDTRIQTVTPPALRELKDGWNQLRPDGETICAKGAPYHFYARRGSPEKLLVFFEGGGGCWRGEDCDRGRPVYEPEIVSGLPGIDPPTLRSRRRQIWRRLPNACRRVYKEANSRGCSAQTVRRSASKLAPSDRSPSEAEPTASFRMTVSMPTRRTERACVIGSLQSRTVSQ